MNVIQGRVVNRRPGRRVPSGGTPNWLKAVYAFLVTVVLLAGLGMIFGPDQGQTPKPNIPNCRQEVAR